jgi:hypothetical protein
MQERVSRVDGQFTLVSEPGHGTKIEVSLPIAIGAAEKTKVAESSPFSFQPLAPT